MVFRADEKGSKAIFLIPCKRDLIDLIIDNSMINYTIIIPHKNIPDLLQRCLDSIPARDDVQVVVVDDNSDEDKVDFNHFPRWKGRNYEFYLTKEGKGAGYARNVGLEHVRGKWLVFLDADDFLEPTVSSVFDEEANTEEDIVFFCPKLVFNDNLDMVSKRGGFEYIRFIENYLETGDETELRTRWHSPCSKFVKSSLVIENSVRFDETRYSNDVMFSVLTGCKAKKIAARNKVYYVITERSGSLTSQFCQKEGELETRSSVFLRAQKVVKDSGYPIDERLAGRFLQRLFDGNRCLFFPYFKTMLKLSDQSRIGLINSVFESHSFASRVKRGAYVFFVSFF